MKKNNKVWNKKYNWITYKNIEIMISVRKYTLHYKSIINE